MEYALSTEIPGRENNGVGIRGTSARLAAIRRVQLDGLGDQARHFRVGDSVRRLDGLDGLAALVARVSNRAQLLAFFLGYRTAALAGLDTWIATARLISRLWWGNWR